MLMISTSAIHALQPVGANPAESQDSRWLDAIHKLAAPLTRLSRLPGVEDVVVNADRSLWVNRTGLGYRREEEFFQAASLLTKLASLRRTMFDHENPILETDMPVDGSRVTGISSPLSRG